MADAAGSHDILLRALQVLERIEAKLDCHEDRIRKIETHPRLLAKTNYILSENAADESVFDSDTSLPFITEPSTGQEPPEQERSITKIPYAKWSVGQVVKPVPDIDGDLTSLGSHDVLFPQDDFAFENSLGDCWIMPDDNRLPLSFFRSSLPSPVWKSNPTQARGDLYHTTRSIERMMDTLCNFDRIHREQAGNDFAVFDFDAVNNSRIYRLGNKAAGSDLLVDRNSTDIAPWSRLILYQGATTGRSISAERGNRHWPIPYFAEKSKGVGVWDHISCHLLLQQRGNTVNPYTNQSTGFHTTFYEIRETEEADVKELWKNGPLYDHPFGWSFRKCAYTIFTPKSTSKVEANDHIVHEIPRHWTMLVLAPNRFFDETNMSFSTKAVDAENAKPLGYTLSKLTRPGAELNLIGQGLGKISQRWTDFQSYFDYILDLGDSLMQPAEHDKFIFDDGAFSRSRRYFWAIDCLSEFEINITDNITQWEMYKAARIDHLKESLPELDKRQLVFAERQYSMLQNQRESFRQKLASTRALRDALFNASAVIESRASTRLGENIKLLTFVSIFFLPLSFTTSLWSVNDQFSLRVLIYVIITVACLTYFIVFNINSLAQGFGRLYNNKKKRIVRAMKRDGSELWRHRGQRFEVFRPKHENPEPSEWYVPLYIIIRPWIILGFGLGSSNAQPRSKSPTREAPMTSRRRSNIMNLVSRPFRTLLFRKRDEVAKDEGRWDEG